MPDTKHRIRLLKRDRKLNLCYIFSCNDTCNLDVVETLLSRLKEKHGIGILAFRNRFGLSQSSEMCESIIPDLPMDFAIFVVHANDNWSINENIDGTGYSKIYSALLKATNGRVLIVIDGDANYKDSSEEQSTVLSHWARRKVSSQFNDEFMDGRKSFIFSWNKEHRPIHEEAMLHFFDPDKKGEKFVPKPKVEATVAPEDPKKADESQERNEADVKATKTKRNSRANQAQKPEAQITQSRREQKEVIMQHPLPTDETQPLSFEYLSRVSMPSHEQQGIEDTSDEFVSLDHRDVSDTWTQPDAGASSLPERIAVLYRDRSDIETIKDVFGDDFQSIAPITSDDPSDLKVVLLIQSVRSCFIVVEARKMKEELQKKSHSTPYGDLLKEARCTVEKKVVVILCNKGSDISSSEENAITSTIEELIGEKGFILWLKGDKRCLQTKRPPLSRSEASPVYDGAAKKESPAHVASPMTPEELVLHTRLRNGKISYEKSDVKVRLKGWTAPQEMADNLLKNNQNIANAELLVYREIKTGNERTVVDEGIKSKLSGMGHSVKGAVESVVQTGVAGVYGIGSTIGLFGSGNTSPSNDESDDLQLD